MCHQRREEANTNGGIGRFLVVCKNLELKWWGPNDEGYNMSARGLIHTGHTHHTHRRYCAGAGWEHAETIRAFITSPTSEPTRRFSFSFPSFLNFLVPCVNFSFLSKNLSVFYPFFINLFQFRRNLTFFKTFVFWLDPNTRAVSFFDKKTFDSRPHICSHFPSQSFSF